MTVMIEILEMVIHSKLKFVKSVTKSSLRSKINFYSCNVPFVINEASHANLYFNSVLLQLLLRY